MSKTIKIPYLSNYDHYGTQRALTLDVGEFAERVRDTSYDLGLTPASWLRAGLIRQNDDTKKFEVTLRGEDLLASADSLPDDPEPEVTTKPCTKCNGLGERPLFVYMETCDHCNGSKVEPSHGRLKYFVHDEIVVTQGLFDAMTPEQLATLEQLMRCPSPENSRLPKTVGTAPQPLVPDWFGGRMRADPFHVLIPGTTNADIGDTVKIRNFDESVEYGVVVGIVARTNGDSYVQTRKIGMRPAVRAARS